MIRFHQDTTLEVVENFNEETEEAGTTEETFRAGEPVDAEIETENGDYVDLQFADGSMAYHVFRLSFEVIGAPNPLAYKPKLDRLPLP